MQNDKMNVHKRGDFIIVGEGLFGDHGYWAVRVSR